MNISNVSCEYFYDEEYDVAKNEGTYNQTYVGSFNNNFYLPINTGEKHMNQLEHDFSTTSRLWSESQLENSENNNYINFESNVFKYISSDNIADMSMYSLSKNLPFFNPAGENSFNYRLCFDQNESMAFKEDFDIRRKFAKKYNIKTFIDSGKCSAATSDSLFNQLRGNPLANSENNLHKLSQQTKKDCSILSFRHKTSKRLWRKLKDIFSLKEIKWKKSVTNSMSSRLCHSYSAPSLRNNDSPSEECLRNNRYSTTIIELYNLIMDLSKESFDFLNLDKQRKSKSMQTIRQACDVGSQCPDSNVRLPRTKSKHINIDYPGLGKIKLPHQLRTSIHHYIENETAFANLKFLENKFEIDHTNTRRCSSTNRFRGKVGKQDIMHACKLKKSRVPSRCASETRYNYHHDNEINKKELQNPSYSNLFIIDEYKSGSFTNLRPIPRKWGLSNGTQILAEFDFSIRSNPIKPVIMEYDEESGIRIGGLVSNVIAAIKLVSETIRNTHDLATICDKFIRCKDSNRQGTSALLSAVDTVLALISDGLSIDSIRVKKNSSASYQTDTKVAMRMWMFIEESCRSSLIKDLSHKLAFSNLLKKVKHICGNTVPDQRSKEWLVQLKLQIFIVIAIKTNILHIWLKSVVINDTILHRFFSSCSFFQQARTKYSNALSLVVVEIRCLSTLETSLVHKSRQISNSSSDNSLSKSKIPRLSKKSGKVTTK